jgi:hypothetical protein
MLASVAGGQPAPAPEAAVEPEVPGAAVAEPGPEVAAPEPAAAPASGHEPPPIIGEWTGPPPAYVPEESILAAGPAMPPTRVTVMGAGRQRKFGEPLFPEGAPPVAAAPAPETPAQAPAATGGIVVAPTAAAGWLVVAGGMIAGVSFLLPWADAVLGSGSVDDSYLGHWGLANAPNILLMLASFGIAWLVVIPSKRFMWLRTGALPIAAGGLLLGVTWPYVLGPYGPRLGLWVTVIGAGLLVAGGIVALYEGAKAGGDAGPEAKAA